MTRRTLVRRVVGSLYELAGAGSALRVVAFGEFGVDLVRCRVQGLLHHHLSGMHHIEEFPHGPVEEAALDTRVGGEF